MKKAIPPILFAMLTLFLVACGGTTKETPVAADIEKAMRSAWDKEGSSSSPKQVYEANSIKIGTGAKANEQDKIDGIPPGAWVTIVRVDFTVRTHYTKVIQSFRRVRDCKVYKDQFGEWAVMIGQRHGEDVSAEEPVKQ